MGELQRDRNGSPPSLAGMVVLVVGGTGLTGSRVMHRLSSLRADDTVLRLMSRSADPTDVSERFGTDVQVVRGDVADATATQEAMADVTHVLYLVGPIPSPSYVLGGKTVEASYVTGLENILRAGREPGRSLCQVVLLSAENCDRPRSLMTMFANTVAGMSQLMHMRQERLLREEAENRPDFGYVIVRPPLLGTADAPPERVTLQSVDPADAVRGRPTRKVSRAAVAELMVHALSTPTGPAHRTFTVSSVDQSPAPADFDWAGLVAAFPEDSDELPKPSTDLAHAHARRFLLTAVATALATTTAAALWLLSSVTGARR